MGSLKVEENMATIHLGNEKVRWDWTNTSMWQSDISLPDIYTEYPACCTFAEIEWQIKIKRNSSQTREYMGISCIIKCNFKTTRV